MRLLPILVIAAVLVAGCTTTETAMEKNGKMKNDTAMKKDYSGTILAGTSAPVIDFNKVDYDKAQASGKIVFLYFYATWCPICRAELPDMYAVFNELNTDRIIGFRVNYNDGDTDADERALAQQFQVPYQHTKVFVKDGKSTGKFPDSWDKARYLSEINKAVG